MPTPTVPRSRSPVPDLDQARTTLPSSSPSRSHSTTLPIAIPGSSLSDLNSKIPAQDACTIGSSSTSVDSDASLSAAIDSAGCTINALAASPVHTSITSESSPSSRQASASPPHSQDGFATNPNPSKSTASLRAQQPTTSSLSNLPPSLTPRPWEFAGPSIRPTVTSSFLRPYTRFEGKQRSDKHTYNVAVELKYVDMAQSTLSGFLSIEGLTEHLPSITTYFTGELIGTRYTFSTRHASWGATDKTDLAHWSRFEAFAPLASQVKHSGTNFQDPNWSNQEHIFMRWKEQFLVPDHRRTDLPGASFEGFYYIVFNQRTGSIGGIYFHSKSEKYQKLELDCVGHTTGSVAGSTGVSGESRRPMRRPMGAPPAIAFR